MNELEYTLFSKGLENLYGSVLIGDGQALEQIEELVYLVRDLENTDSAGAAHGPGIYLDSPLL